MLTYLARPKIRSLLQQTKKHKLVIPYDQHYPPLVLNAIAEHIRKPKELIAWAYKIDKIDFPRKYQVLYPISLSSQIKLDNCFSSRLAFLKKNNFIVKITTPIVTLNQNITDVLNNVYQALTTPARISPLFVFGIFVLGGIFITPTFMIALLFNFPLGLSWAFFIIIVFWFGFDMGRRIR